MHWSRSTQQLKIVVERLRMSEACESLVVRKTHS